MPIRTCNHHLLPALSCMILCGSLQATTISVNTFSDEINNDGDCSLREAVEAANTNAAVDNCPAGSAIVVDVIDADLIGTFSLTIGSLRVTDQVEMYGFGSQLTRIDGNNQRQLIIVDMANPDHDFSLSKVSLQHGRSSSTAAGTGGGAVQLMQGHIFDFDQVHFEGNGTYFGGGGAIKAGPLIGNPDSILRIHRSKFVDNFGELLGGAVLAFPDSGEQVPASISITDSLFDGNWSDLSGGALHATGVDVVTLRRNQFVDNASDRSGGAISVGARSSAGATSPIVQIQDSSFIDNRSENWGGAVSFVNAVALVTNSTFSGNTSAEGYRGNAVGTFSGSTATIQYATFHDNGNGTANEASVFVCSDCDVSMRSSVIWTASALDNDCNLDFNATYTSLGANVDGSGTCATAATDLAMTDPRLQPLGGYGFPTTAFVMLTMPPRASSPAIDLGASGSCPGPFGTQINVDQMDRARPVAGGGSGTARCDSGAMEYQPGVDPGEFTLSVSLAGAGTGTVSSNPAAINCPATCSSVLDEDTVVTLQAVAANGSAFAGWSGDCTGAGSCQVSMDKARAVSATFNVIEPDQFPLTVSLLGDGSGSVSSASAEISCPGTCSASFDDGSLVTLTPVAANGSQFAGWGGACSGSGSCQVSMDQARYVSATFNMIEPDQFLLTVSILGDGSGTVSSATPAISCPGTCSASFDDGSLVALTPVAANGSRFAGWGGACSGSGSCQVSMDQARNVSATFNVAPDFVFGSGFE